MDYLSYALSKKYTDDTVEGGGAIRGKNCIIKSIEDIEGGHRITFQWTLDNGKVQTDVMDVADGEVGPKGDPGEQGPKGDKGDTGDRGPKGDTGDGSDEEAGWKLPVDEIRTTNTLPTGVSAGYRVAIVTSSVMAIKEYNGSSWDTESLDPYSVIPLKHSGGIQMYLAKSTGPVYMGVEYGVFGKFRFMTQAAYDALSSYDEDTIYFVRSS